MSHRARVVYMQFQCREALCVGYVRQRDMDYIGVAVTVVLVHDVYWRY